ncbi:MAG TPA: RNA polymerase sigma factor, partial [Candidatus Paceibacterota bacterium]|nr:RNA polymerase sigma factor [Candidatus Paceibacterota bacterium]
MEPLTSDCTDTQLLQEFAQRRSDAAFRELTQRHVNLVFGTAFRATGERSAAEEITQNVFIALAKKAAWLQRESSVAAWLHRVALLESRQWWRAETRHRARERTAAELETTMKTTGQTESAMAAMLDEALLELREGERQAVLLRYFEGRNNREIGAALGIGEDAARKRLDKAMGQLLAFFRRRGLAVGSAAILTAALTGAANTAPLNLAATASAAALASGTGSLPLLAKLLGLNRAKLAALCLTTLLLPVVWQQARLVSARAEERRMEALLSQLQSRQADLQRDLVQTLEQVSRASAELADVQRGLTNTMALALLPEGGIDPRLFLWNDKVDYVRVPKSVLRRVRFDGSKDRWGLNSDFKKTFDREHKRISAAVLDAMGLNAAQKQRAQEILSRHLDGYREWAAAHSQTMDYPTLVATVTNLPPGIIQNDYTRVWLT